MSSYAVAEKNKRAGTEKIKIKEHNSIKTRFTILKYKNAHKEVLNQIW